MQSKEIESMKKKIAEKIYCGHCTDVPGRSLIAMVTVLVLMVLKSVLLPSACSPQVCAFGAPAHGEGQGGLEGRQSLQHGRE